MRVTPGILVTLALLTLAADARAEAPPERHVDGGLVVALPTALSAGLLVGVGAGAAQRVGPVVLGAGLSWAALSEYSLTWIVEQEEIRLRAHAGLERRVGRGLLAVRLGLGGTLVHETRTRQQGDRAGLAGADLETTAWRLLPGVDLEGAVGVEIIDRWAFALRAGPSLHLVDGGLGLGWTALVGVGWTP